MMSLEARMHVCAEHNDELGLRLLRLEDKIRFDKEVARVKMLSKAKDYLSPILSKTLNPKSKREIRNLAYMESVAQKKKSGVNV